MTAPDLERIERELRLAYEQVLRTLEVLIAHRQAGTATPAHVDAVVSAGHDLHEAKQAVLGVALELEPPDQAH